MAAFSLWRAAGDPLELGELHAELARVDEPLLGATVPDLDHAGLAGDAYLVDPVLRPDHQRALAAQADQRLGDRLLIAAVGNARGAAASRRPGWSADRGS